MSKVLFHEGWSIRSLTKEGSSFSPISLPHDAMLHERRSPEAEGGVNTAWFVAEDYEYRKTFSLPLLEGEKAVLEFEGVYRNAEIYLNGLLIHKNHYGYNDFFVNLTPHLKDGENELLVKAFNSDQPNSRWYTGTGIYRPVYLHLLKKRHFLPNSIKILTKDYREGLLSVSGKTSFDGSFLCRIENQQGETVFQKEIESMGGLFSSEIKITDPLLWGEKNPYLYKLILSADEEESIRFGIRQIEFGEQGLLVNGERVILKGACIHHDNGLLGAATYQDAERRKITLLRKAGYNAIRSAHNPISKAALDACDELGMFVMDEYADCWYIHKTKHDYVNWLESNWKDDLRLMVEKDFNHPSVILYSTGNEVSETAYPKGIALTKEFTDYLHEVDPSRPVTCGVNIFFNALSSLGFGVYSDKKAEKNSQAKAKKQEVGSAFFNKIANFVGSNVMKVGAKLPICDRKTKGAFANMDVAGYNYGIFRYRHDLKKYPHRLIVGSETFCSDARRWYELAKKQPRLIGDFVWAGVDYLGECGIGSWVNEEDAPSFDHGCGWITAGSGRIDITGRFLGEAMFTQVIYGVKPIEMAIIMPKEFRLKHSQSAWKFSMAMPYYDFPKEEEGKKVGVEIYSLGETVELFLNGKSLGRKKAHKSGRTMIYFPYRLGELKAVAYGKDDRVLGETSLSTSEEKTRLCIEKESGHPSENDHLLYVRLQLNDGLGRIRPYEKDVIEINDIQGGELLGFGNSNPYNEEGYLGKKARTYFGEAVAIFRVDEEKEFNFTAKSAAHGETTFR